jgi:hypothetical protein
VTGRATGRLVGEAPHKTHRLVDAAVILSRTTRALGIMQPWCMQAAGSGRQVVVGIRALRAQQAAVLLLRRLAMLLVRLYSRTAVGPVYIQPYGCTYYELAYRSATVGCRKFPAAVLEHWPGALSGDCLPAVCTPARPHAASGGMPQACLNRSVVD